MKHLLIHIFINKFCKIVDFTKRFVDTYYNNYFAKNEFWI